MNVGIIIIIIIIKNECHSNIIVDRLQVSAASVLELVTQRRLCGYSLAAAAIAVHVDNMTEREIELVSGI